jgi:hypothetical protein
MPWPFKAKKPLPASVVRQNVQADAVTLPTPGSRAAFNGKDNFAHGIHLAIIFLLIL